ncbi:SDR family NAD(P)-dependent oxidoreductase [Tateyamaria sp. ANG-S1]|uniref:SDR family NAD(P)-dependent oxidoreductase n=1 Tax=Tateyamaria sp. ANG-S1 TaxID=1577905 RepID=UPI001F4CF205|nr:SDR family NAD(P)-dependent oxidoreductase [Tateyamaria sp. ANG-S1]
MNLFGVIAMTRAVLPPMRQQKSGLIINLSSSAGRLSIPYFGLYCASKWALETWVETLNYELQPHGVESILLEPSGHGTDRRPPRHRRGIPEWFRRRPSSLVSQRRGRSKTSALAS